MIEQIVFIKPKSIKRIRTGHPWIFNNELVELPDYQPGSLVTVLDYNKQFVGRGYYNPHSLISIRILSRNQNENINSDFFKRNLVNAFHYRQTIYPDNQSYRLLYSEGDFLPGLIIDKYENHFVIQILTKGMEYWKDTICQILVELFHPVCIYERSDSNFQQMENLPPLSQSLYGTPDNELIIQQDGIKFLVDIKKGQKTGYFFDQRDNRIMLKNLVDGKTVLDLFCGNGSWSCYAGFFGASHITGIDSSEHALHIAKNNIKLNQIESKCNFINSDVPNMPGELLQNQFDIVICDPPAFAKSKRHIPTAIKGYQKLNILAYRLTKPGGILITSSCSYHIDRSTFEKILQTCSSKTGRPAQKIWYGTQSLDHPIQIHIPETEYLKCYALKISEQI